MVVRTGFLLSPLVFLLLCLCGFWPIIPPNVSALQCFNFHDFAEEGKQRTITKGLCGASNGYCVKAVYSDEQFRSKNGFSLGCDKTDCVGVGDPTYGWSADGCKRHEDYGSGGLICCCTTHLCNGGSVLGRSLPNTLLFLALSLLMNV
uniref:Protein quiver n=1 Tax=Steinernema glaseri TaxID=37863 RepID=A0A1I8A3K0_9BILA